jgi:hypothetical protein
MVRLAIVVFFFACASPLLLAIFAFKALAKESRPLSVKCLAAGAIGGVLAGIILGAIVLNQNIHLGAVPLGNWLGFISAGFSIFSLAAWAAFAGFRSTT